MKIWFNGPTGLRVHTNGWSNVMQHPTCKTPDGDSLGSHSTTQRRVSYPPRSKKISPFSGKAYTRNTYTTYTETHTHTRQTHTRHQRSIYLNSFSWWKNIMVQRRCTQDSSDHILHIMACSSIRHPSRLSEMQSNGSKFCAFLHVHVGRWNLGMCNGQQCARTG